MEGLNDSALGQGERESERNEHGNVKCPADEDMDPLYLGVESNLAATSLSTSYRCVSERKQAGSAADVGGGGDLRLPLRWFDPSKSTPCRVIDWSQVYVRLLPLAGTEVMAHGRPRRAKLRTNEMIDRSLHCSRSPGNEQQRAVRADD